MNHLRNQKNVAKWKNQNSIQRPDIVFQHFNQIIAPINQVVFFLLSKG